MLLLSNIHIVDKYLITDLTFTANSVTHTALFATEITIEVINQLKLAAENLFNCFGKTG